jgi:hypothetical protein
MRGAGAITAGGGAISARRRWPSGLFSCREKNFTIKFQPVISNLAAHVEH